VTDYDALPDASSSRREDEPLSETRREPDSLRERTDWREPVPEGHTTFEMDLGDLRVRVEDLPTCWEPFVTEQYAPFAEAPGSGRPPELVVRCREGEGLRVALPPRDEATVIEVEAIETKRFLIRSHWQDGWVDLERGEGELTLTDRAWDRFTMSVENYLRVTLQLASIDRGAFLLHAAGVLDEGRVFLFFGPSGSGKSTATANSAPRRALSDDMVLIDVSRNPPVARAVPFHMVYSPEKRARGTFEIAAGLRLRQSPADRAARMTPARAVASVSASVPFVHELGLPHEGLTALIALLCRNVPIYDLELTNSPRFWDVLADEGLR
jgi:hypothetical protein